MAQNTSHAVMAQRVEPRDSLDFFPTPPWAVRALCEYIIDPIYLPYSSDLTVLEPACGAGDMARGLRDYFDRVTCSDVEPRGVGERRDFLLERYQPDEFNWVITNPPFNLAEEFVSEGLRVGSHGVAILARTTFAESVGRYERLFKVTPPAIVAQFCERVPMVKGRLDATASTATGYAWFVWRRRGRREETLFRWLPPCRKRLERASDYEAAQ